MPQISERRRMQNRLAQRKFRDKKQQQQLQLQQQQQQEQQQQQHHQQQQQQLQHRQRTNSYLQSPTGPVPSRRKPSAHEEQVRPPIKHMPHQPHGLPQHIAAPVFSVPEFPSLSTYGSELGEMMSPEELSYFPSADSCAFPDNLDLEFSHFALSSDSLSQSMSHNSYDDYTSFSDTASYYGDIKPHSSAGSSHRPSFSHQSTFPSLESQFALPSNPYMYPRKQSITSSGSYHSCASTWSGLSSATHTETEDTTPSVDPENQQMCYFSAASVPLAEPKAASCDTPVFLKRSWSGITSPPQDAEFKPLLHVSAKGGRDNIVRTLIRQGVNVNELDSQGFTALELAMRHGHQSTVRILMESGADMNATAGPMWGPFNGTTLDPLDEDLTAIFAL